MINWLRRYIPHLSDYMKPLHELEKATKPKRSQFYWPDPCNEALCKIQQLLRQKPFLRHPNLQQKFYVAVDASDLGWGAVLLQKGDDDLLHPVEFWSNGWTEHSKKWYVGEKELAAMVLALEHWSKYLLIQHFTVYTDHKNLEALHTKLITNGSFNPKFDRWLIRIEQFNFDAFYIEGIYNYAADYLSRDHLTSNGAKEWMHQQLPDYKMRYSPNMTQLARSPFFTSLPRGTAQPLNLYINNSDAITPEHLICKDVSVREQDQTKNIKIYTERQHCIHTVRRSSRLQLKRQKHAALERMRIADEFGQLRNNQSMRSPDTSHEDGVTNSEQMDISSGTSAPNRAGTNLGGGYPARREDDNITLNRTSVQSPRPVPMQTNDSVHSDHDQASRNYPTNEQTQRRRQRDLCQERESGQTPISPVTNGSATNRSNTVDSNNQNDPNSPVSSARSQSEARPNDPHSVSSEHIALYNQQLVQETNQHQIDIDVILDELQRSDDPEHKRIYQAFQDKLDITVNRQVLQSHLLNDAIFCSIITVLKKKDNALLYALPTFIQTDVLKNRFSVKDQLLFYKNGKKSGYVVPPKLQLGILRYFHCSLEGGHQGVERMNFLMNGKFWWYGITKDVQRFVGSCRDCNAAKRKSNKSEGFMQLFEPDECFETVHIDIVGPMPCTKSGNQYILTMMDRWSRMVKLIPINVCTATNIAWTIRNNWFLEYGAPINILSDRGSYFTGLIFKILTKLNGVHHLFTTSYHPQTNGRLERFHRYLKERLRIIASSKELNFLDNHDWDGYIPSIAFSYNVTPN